MPAGVSFSTTASRAASTAAICAITSSSLSTSRSMRECAAAGIFPPPVWLPKIGQLLATVAAKALEVDNAQGRQNPVDPIQKRAALAE